MVSELAASQVNDVFRSVTHHIIITMRHERAVAQDLFAGQLVRRVNTHTLNHYINAAEAQLQPIRLLEQHVAQGQLEIELRLHRLVRSLQEQSAQQESLHQQQQRRVDEQHQQLIEQERQLREKQQRMDEQQQQLLEQERQLREQLRRMDEQEARIDEQQLQAIELQNRLADQ